jgi:hypothetical protein
LQTSTKPKGDPMVKKAKKAKKKAAKKKKA